MNEAERAYNTPDFVLKMPDLSRLGDTMPIHVGAQAPEFQAQTLDGQVVRLEELTNKGHVVLMMGSLTSPMCAIQLPAMNRLAKEYSGKRIAFYLVYTKESHPGERYRHHESMEQKIAHARDLQRLEHVQFPILVDSLDGQVHRSFGPWPTSLFVVHRDGRLVFRSTIAEPVEIELYLKGLVESDRLAEEHPDRVPHTSYTEWIIEHEVDEGEHHRVYERAGPKAFEDFWKLYPGLRGKWPGPA